MIKKLFNNYHHLLVGLIAFVIYYQTTSRSIGEIDSGELAAVQVTWGISHPTGYPLFSLLGYLYSKIPIVKPLIFQLNLFQGILNSITVIILVKILQLLLSNFQYLVDKKKYPFLSSINFSNNIILLSSIIGAFTFAFSVTFWKQATRVEVYSLQILLTTIILYYIFKVLIKFSKSEEIKISNWYLLSIFIGLAFSNHLMTLYLIPAILYLFFLIKGFNRDSFVLFLKLFLLSFSIALLFYFTMIFRAKSQTAFTFMNEPQSFSALIDYVRGKYYESKMFQGVGSIKQQSLQFLKILSFDKETGFTGGEFGLLIIMVFSGLVSIAMFLKRVGLLYLLIIGTSLFFVLNYSIPDIDEYFLVIFLLFAISSALIIGLILHLSRRYYFVIAILFLLIISLQVFNNYNFIDKSSDFVIEDYSRGILSQVPPNSIILTSDWPLFAAPSFFLQYALGYRKDVEVVGVELLPFHFYKIELKKKYGSVENLLSQDYFITFDIFKDYIREGKFNLGNKILIPEGLYFRVTNDTDYSEYYPDLPEIRFLKKDVIYNEYIYHLVGFMIETRARYELQHQKIDKAKKFLSLLAKKFPQYSISPELRTYLN